MRFPPHRVQKILLTALVAGVTALWAGDRFSLPQAMATGALVLAVVPLVIGVRALATGRFRIRIDRYGEYQESYRGIGARALGLLLLLVSIALAGYSVLKFAGLEHMATNLIDRSPGVVAVAIGVGLALFGTTQASKVTVLQRGQVRRICMIPERIGGALTALVGLALIAGGLLHTASPVLFDKAKTFMGRALISLLS